MNTSRNSKRPFLKIILWPFKSYLRILGVVIIIGAYQYQSIEIDILAREVRSLELKRNQLVSENTALQVQIDRLTHINRIEKLANQKFGLVASGTQLERLVIKPFSHVPFDYPEQQKKKLKLAGVQ